MVSVTVFKDGTITFSRAPNPDVLSGYKEDFIKDINLDLLKEYVELQISSIYSNNVIPTFTIEDNIWIQKNEDGAFYLLLPVVINKQNNAILTQEIIYALD